MTRIRRFLMALARRTARPTPPALPMQPPGQGECDECWAYPGEEHQLTCPEVSYDEFRAYLGYRAGGER